MPDDSLPLYPETTTSSTLGEMYADYFLDYASYVIMERAVPHLYDGLKPVQRRILHSMKELEDGRYNKVANIVGNTMKYHPHGDASISDAIVQLGQKNLLIDTQGNWGNTLTGDRAAASRYIEARLTPFALDVVFNPKTTQWTSSYDGRNKEPITLPLKFPLLLAQGVEGIAVGLACKVLPHNFIELIEGAIAALRNEPFHLLPDFPTGGIMDGSNYQDGLRGGKIRIRADITIEKKRLLRIVQIPYGVTTGSLMDSIVAANEKGTIKIARIEDNTAAEVDILVYLPTGTDPEQTREALYAFTDCEVSISPNACVIADGKPRFLGVSSILKHSAKQTKALLQRELEIRLEELQEQWHIASLERIFIENRLYRNIEQCETWEAVLTTIDESLKPYTKNFLRPVSRKDIIQLTEIKIKRISRYDTLKAQEHLTSLQKDIESTQKNLNTLTRYTISYLQKLKKNYGKGRERRTRIESFETINRSEVVLANETLYLDATNGFAGWGLKKEEAIEKCSPLDDIIVINKEGVLTISKVAPKSFIGKRPLYVSIFRKQEEKIFSLIYRDGLRGNTYAKRFRVGGITRDKPYPLTKATPSSRIFYLAIHDSEEESNNNKVLIHLKSSLRLRNLSHIYDFSTLAIKGRSARGNLVTKHAIDRIVRAPHKESLR